jgi:hypothetical protein
MNISSSFQFTSPNIANLSTASSSQLPVGQAQIENRGSVIQPVVEIATTAAANNNRSQVAALDNNQKSSDKQVAASNNEVSAQVQDQLQQEVLTKELERRQIQELVLRDRQVRDHERAHTAVGGQYAGPPRYTFERGPDGINYAVAGEVSISAGAVSGDPAATIQKAQVVRRAALAPTDPSAQDRSVAAQAAHIESQARVELRNLESQARLAESDVAEARIKNRQVNTGSTSKAVEANDSSVSASISPNSLQDSIVEKAENRVQRLSDDLNLRLSRADPFAGGPEPGQIFSQFI